MDRRLVAGVLVAMLAASGRSRAQAPPRCATELQGAPALAEIAAPVRLAFVRDVMRDQARRARLWSWGWGIGGLALAAGNYTQAALTKTPDDRIDPLVGGTTSLFIPAAILVKPLRVTSDAAALEEYLALTSTSLGPMEPCLQLARAEELLALSADDEAESAGIFAQVVAIGGNGAIALFLGLGFNHWTGALINGVGGFLISEAQIFTQPTGAVDALARYRRGEIDTAPRAPIAWSLSPLVVGAARGLALQGRF